MPLDGTGFEQQIEQDEVLALLRRARERVAQGWCQKEAHNRDGQYCVRGALFADIHQKHVAEATDVLFDALPLWHRRRCKARAIVAYNDHHCRTLAQIVALFDRAIAKRAGG